MNIREILCHPNHSYSPGKQSLWFKKTKKKKEASESICQEQQSTDWYQNIPATNDNKHRESTFHHLIRFNWTFSSFDIFLKTCENEGT